MLGALLDVLDVASEGRRVCGVLWLVLCGVRS